LLTHFQVKMANISETVKQFIALGLSDQKARETLKNVNVTKNLTSAISHLKNLENLDTGVGMVIYHTATKIKPQILSHLPLLVKLIVENKLDTPMRVDAALDYLLTNNATQGSPVNQLELEQTCGVGVIITPEKIDKAVEKQIKLNETEILEKRYRFNVGKILQDVRADPEMKWADGKKVKMELDVQLFDLLGPKTESDLAPVSKTDKKIKPDARPAEIKSKCAENNEEGAGSIAELMRSKVHFHAPGENYKTDGYIVTENTNKLLKDHLMATNGKVRTRFPPEPNGILHIGHAKAININFGYAAANDGICFLRYDDTNPEKEEEKFFVGIKNMVNRI
jgi:glutaminyl-tRNA synthetase